jgi:hypothetical protein
MLPIWLWLVPVYQAWLDIWIEAASVFVAASPVMAMAFGIWFIPLLADEAP